MKLHGICGALLGYENRELAFMPRPCIQLFWRRDQAADPG